MANTPVSSFELPQMTDLVNETFIDKLKNLPQVMRNAPFITTEMVKWAMFKRFSETVHTGQYTQTRDEGDVSAQMKYQSGYSKDLAIKVESIMIGITKVMREAAKDDEIMRKITALTEKVPASIDLDLAHRFTFAFASSYVDRSGNTVDVTTADGLALAHATHTLTGSSTTYSTIITSNPPFSKTALVTAVNQFTTSTFDNLGNKIDATPDVILTTDDEATVLAVRELMFATADTATSNSGTFNNYYKRYTHIIAPRIATTATGGVDTTKAKYWALICSDLSDFKLGILKDAELSSPNKGNNGEDIASGNWSYVVDAMYGNVIVTARAFRLSKGDAS